MRMLPKDQDSAMQQGAPRAATEDASLARPVDGVRDAGMTLTDAECIAIFRSVNSGGDPTHHTMRIIRAAYAAGAASVPREPSAAMFIAGTTALAEAEGSFARAVWQAMHDAATGVTK